MQCISSLLLDLFSLHAAGFTENPRNTTVLLGEQAIFSCLFENITTFPDWTDTDGGVYTVSATEGNVRYIQVNSTMVSLNVTATPARDGVCFSCISNSIAGPVESAQGCLTIAGKQSMSSLTMCIPAVMLYVCMHTYFITVQYNRKCYCVHVTYSVQHR